MTLKYPALLFFIPIVFVGLWLASNQWKEKRLLFPIARRNFHPKKKFSLATTVPFFTRFLALSILMIALARPVTSSSQTRRLAEGIDIMIALDVSQSMLIEDSGNRNRLEIAKETVKRFIQGRSDDKIGFLMFSGEGITLCPPTLDYQALLDAVDSSQTSVLKDGTAIGDAIANATNRLKDSKAKSRVIILITDGDNNMGAIAPLTAGDIATGYGIKVYSIALGKEGLVNIPEEVNIFGFTRKTYKTIQSTINPALLMKISKETGGKFFRAQDSDSLRRVFEEIDKLERTKISTKERVLWEEHFQSFLLVALALLLLDLLLRATVFRILPG